MTKLEKLMEEVFENIALYNQALKNNDYKGMESAESRLKEAEADYATEKNLEVFTKLRGSESPVKEAIRLHSYEVIGHRAVREDGVTIELESIVKSRQIDLVRFFEFCKLETDWKHKVDKFNQLMCLRAGKELGLSKKELTKICDSFYMNRLAKAVEMGQTPDSNTAMVKQLQMIVDDVIYEDNGKGKNIYRVNNHDVAYFLMSYTKRGKTPLTVAVAKTSFVHRILFDILHRLVTNKVYGLDYQMIKTKATVERVKVEEPITNEALEDEETHGNSEETIEVEQE